MISGKRGEFGDPENQRFRRNRGLFRVKVREKGGIFSAWRTLMGHPNSLLVGVPGIGYRPTRKKFISLTIRPNVLRRAV